MRTKKFSQPPNPVLKWIRLRRTAYATLAIKKVIVLASTWIAYNELAWTEDWLADPVEYEDEVMVYVDLIKRTVSGPPQARCCIWGVAQAAMTGSLSGILS